MNMNRTMFGLVIAAGLIASALSAPVLASAVLDFFTIKSAIVSVADDRNVLRANLITHGLIPTDGSEGAFGYGVITDDGDAILVTTTHAGVLDSEDQSFILDPIWHNHFVRLGDVDACGTNPGVVDISWQSPGRVSIIDHRAYVSRVPTGEFSGSNSINGAPMSAELGEDPAAAVSFKLSPIFTAGGLQAVCVTDITPAQNLQVKQVD